MARNELLLSVDSDTEMLPNTITEAVNERDEPCVAGKKMIVVNEKAEVLPSEMLHKKLGNLKDYDYDIPRLLANARSPRLVRWIRTSKCHCTFECAWATSIVYHKPSYARILWRTIKQRLSRRPRSAAATQPEHTGIPLPILGSGGVS